MVQPAHISSPEGSFSTAVREAPIVCDRGLTITVRGPGGELMSEEPTSVTPPNNTSPSGAFWERATSSPVRDWMMK